MRIGWKASPHAVARSNHLGERNVKNTAFAILLACLWLQAHAEECDLDQKTRVQDNIALKKKYPGSHLAEKNLVVVVPVAEGEVRINIGGCVDYGVTVELRMKHAASRLDADQLMQKIAYLAKTYAQGEVDAAKLEDAIRKRNWTQPQEGTADYYLHYDSIRTFEVYDQEGENGAVIGFNMY